MHSVVVNRVSLTAVRDILQPTEGGKARVVDLFPNGTRIVSTGIPHLHFDGLRVGNDNDQRRKRYDTHEQGGECAPKNPLFTQFSIFHNVYLFCLCGFSSWRLTAPAARHKLEHLECSAVETFESSIDFLCRALQEGGNNGFWQAAGLDGGTCRFGLHLNPASEAAIEGSVP